MCTKNGSYCEKEKSHGGGQGRCERRSEALVKIQKKNIGGGQGGYEWRSEAFVKIQFFFFPGGGGGGGGGQGGCEQRSEACVKIQKKKNGVGRDGWGFGLVGESGWM